jgi:hypothetical protein
VEKGMSGYSQERECRFLCLGLNPLHLIPLSSSFPLLVSSHSLSRFFLLPYPPPITRYSRQAQITSAHSQPTISPPERALYAAITSDLPTLLPACKSWEDQLWARILSRIEARIEQRWKELGGFWEQESRTLGRDEDGVLGSGGAAGGAGLEVVFAEIGEVHDPVIQ